MVHHPRRTSPTSPVAPRPGHPTPATSQRRRWSGSDLPGQPQQTHSHRAAARAKSQRRAGAGRVEAGLVERSLCMGRESLGNALVNGGRFAASHDKEWRMEGIVDASELQWHRPERGCQAASAGRARRTGGLRLHRPRRTRPGPHARDHRPRGCRRGREPAARRPRRRTSPNRPLARPAAVRAYPVVVT